MPGVDIYAVAGDPALHSISPALFRRAFDAQGIPATYTRLAADSAREALDVARAVGMRGINVTSPFKEEMLALVESHDEAAGRVGAVNVVALEGGSARGLNVDGDGVIAMCARAGFDPAGSRVVVLGAGGAAKAAALALRMAGASVTIANRTEARGREAAARVGCESVPLSGAAPAIAEAAAVFACWPRGASGLEPSTLRREQILFDANYGDSPLAETARRAGCRYADGSEWLLGQARSSFRIFTGGDAPEAAMREGLEEMRANGHVILSGMMGTGKSRVAGELASRLGLEAVDTDAIVERMSKMRIADIFRQYGEAEFRRLEAVAIEDSMGNARSVIALGGGALTNPKLALLARERGTVVWLWASPERCAERASDGMRPLLEGKDPVEAMQRLLSERLASYAAASDLIVSTEGRDAPAVAGKVFDEIHKSGKG